ncbi:MAG TPA: hypothetical protein VER55_02740 [Ardenticatenaceae bacterium]|nr:hypothetical protein [Ardenticatenaceae bacterium]
MYKTATAYRSAQQRRDRSSDFELYAWFFMRVSGIILLFIAVFHLLYMHFVVGVTKIDFDVIAQRWTGPAGTFWRTYDMFLLVLSFTHGTNGVRYVLEDYIPGQGLRVLSKTLLYLLFAALMFMGAYVIWTFELPA